MSIINIFIIWLSIIALHSNELYADKQEPITHEQISALTKQLEDIAKLIKITEQKLATSQENCKKEKIDLLEPGYKNISNTSINVKVSGAVRLDSVYDAKNNTGEFPLISRMPYDLSVHQNNSYSWKKHFYMYAKNSRLRFDSVAKTSTGKKLSAFIDIDFFNASNFGDTAVNGAVTLSSTYSARIRNAALSYEGFEAGYTITTFNMVEAMIPVIFASPNALLRYSHKINKNADVSIAAEHSRADYIRFNPNNLNGTYTVPYSRYSYSMNDFGPTGAHTNNFSKTERPDFVARTRYFFDNGSMIGLAAIYRDLRIRDNSGVGGMRADGMGVNLSARIMTIGKSYIVFMAVAGKGLGGYVIDASGRSAFYDPVSNSQPVYKAIPMTAFMAGYHHSWNAQWSSVFAIHRIDFKTKSFNDNVVMPANSYDARDPGIDRLFTRFIINTTYKPDERLEFSLEFSWLQRRSINTNRGTGTAAEIASNSYTGNGQRFQFSTIYKF